MSYPRAVRDYHNASADEMLTGIVFARCHHSLVRVGYIALQSTDQGVDVGREMVWIFSWSFYARD